ncbi:MAG: 16S rRNA (adenine(1518)-N(6)/adenine(1519)-N(6))-dimethyltransferase RsmA [Ruminococcus sp.]|nr:16S rRNA (adenine(1518)-N(6)/adenine(1519)-N(6))-dimethyltransferase RsmA [Ruminococcus sp.]MCD7800982.1 16S rRNA (adenine(1518)-N(6)/adenine(1519)-N(6))-dimethyltransferase RsmA [Ruminococcus sp.]
MENLTNISVVKDILSRHGFNFSKSLGQNFLINPTVCPRIAELGNAKEGYGILEIGTGFGVLTCELAKRANKVVAIEIDSRLIPILKETLSEFDNVKVINADVMKVDLNQTIRNEFQGLKVSVCANLPYYITSPIIMMLLENHLPIESITVMVQREAGQRLCAKVGTRDTGAITVAVNYYATVTKLFDVNRGSFMPSPNVDSCVIRLDIHKDRKLSPKDEEFFFKVVKGAFSQRRKTLTNTISSSMAISKCDVSKALESIGISPSTRAESLTMEQFIKFSQSLQQVTSL